MDVVQVVQVEAADETAGEILYARDAAKAAFAVNYRQGAHALALQDLAYFVEGIVFVHKDYGACHDVCHTRANVGDQEGRVYAEAVEDVGRFGAYRSLASSDCVCLPLRVQQSSVPDRRTYGVGVRVLVPQDIDRP